jgi:type IV pilus assembly protein PilM
MVKSVVGLDIGTSVIRAAEVSDPKKARPTLLRYHEVPLPPNSAVRGEVIEVETVASALRQLWAAGGFKSKAVVLGVGSQRVIARDMTVPRMPLAQIRESLPFQVQDMLPVPVSEALLDFYPVSEGVGEGGPVVHGLLVAAVKSAVMANVTAVQKAGLNPVEVDLIPFALARSLLSSHPDQGTVALVHIGSVTTSMVIAMGGIPQFVRIIPSGGDDITAALVSRLNIEQVNAEQIKRGLGFDPASAGPEWRPAIDIIREVSGELLNSIRNTLNFYVNSRQTPPVETMILAGGASQLRGFAAALQEITKIRVTESDPFERFTVAKSVDAALLEASKRGIAVALGLTLGAHS